MKEDLKRSGIRQDGLEKRFDAFCKQVIRNAIYDVLRKEDRRQFFEQTGIGIPSDELLYEVNVEDPRLKDTVDLIRDVHPYEEPLINIIPLGTESDL